MSDARIVASVERGTRRVSDVDVVVTELVWGDGGRSFEVHTADGVDLTEDECFDRMPTDDQVAVLLYLRAPNQEEEGTS